MFLTFLELLHQLSIKRLLEKAELTQILTTVSNARKVHLSIMYF